MSSIGLEIRQPLRGARFVPQVDGFLTVSLQGEVTRGTVHSVHDEDTAIVKLTSVVMGKSHHYKRGDVVPVRRARGALGDEIWEVISDRELEMQRAAARLAEEERARNEAEAARIAALSAVDAPAPETPAEAPTGLAGVKAIGGAVEERQLRPSRRAAKAA
jgi:hypothetical protein